MKTTDYGEVIVSADDVFEALYNGQTVDFTNCRFDDPNIINQFNCAIAQNADSIPDLTEFIPSILSIEEFDKLNQGQWFMPEEYKNFEIVRFLLDKTQNEEQYQRVVQELELYAQHNMIMVLKYLKYLVDTMRQNNIVWGVGRGSSVASYCLYLIGVHKVDSIKYELDINEFLK
jgi:DNA polymerase III alpha subunit